MNLHWSKVNQKRDDIACVRNKKEKLIPILAIFQLKEELNDA